MTVPKTSLARIVFRLAQVMFAGAATALLFAANLVWADDLYNWQPVKIGAGGFVTGFVTHPKNAAVRYCRTDVGNAYRWNSSTGEWVPMVIDNQSSSGGMPASAAPAPAASGVESLAVDPQNVHVLYMAFKSGFSADVTSQYTTVKGSVFKSTDGGQTFSRSDLSVDMNANSNWRSAGERMAVDPDNSAIVYYGSNDSGLWRSTNGGAHWGQVTTGGAPDSSKVILGIQFDPTAGTIGNFGVSVAKIAYAITLDGGVYKTSDGGANWSDIASGIGLEGHASNSTVSPDGSLWVVQSNTNTVWHYSGGAWSSTSVNFGWGQSVSGVAVDPNNSSRLWAIGVGGALSRTENTGISWNPCYHQLLFANTTGWLPQNPQGYRSVGGIFYDRNGALWVPEGNEGVMTYTPTNTETNSDTGGPHWSIQSQGIEEFVTHDVILPPGGKPVVAVEDGTGFVINDPTRFTATQIPLQDQLISNGTGLAYCPNHSSYLAVATADVNNTGSGSNYSGYSTDSGASWQRFASYPVDSSGNLLKQAGSIAVSRRNGWGAGSDHLVWVPTASQPESWSSDGGKSWHQGNGFPTTSAYWTFSLKQRALKADPFVADKFYYVATWSGGCYVSTDGGQNWAKQSGSTLPTATHHGQLEVNRAVQNDLWFVDGWEGASAHGLWHSADGGVTFTHSRSFDYAIALALGKGSGNAADLAYSVYVYGRLAGDSHWGVFRSNNGGGSWVRVAYYPTGIFDQPTCLGASWDTYGIVYAGFNGNSFVYGIVTGKGHRRR